MQSAVASTEWPCLTFAIGAAVIRKVINPKDTIPSRPSADSAARRSIAPASARHRLFGRFYHRRTSKRQQDRDHHRCRRWQGLIGTAGLRMTAIDLYFELVPHSAMAAKLTRTKVGRWASQRLQSSCSDACARVQISFGPRSVFKTFRKVAQSSGRRWSGLHWFLKGARAVAGIALITVVERVLRRFDHFRPCP